MKLGEKKRMQRQRMIIRLLAQEYRMIEIADMMKLSTRTIRREIKLIEKSDDKTLMNFTLMSFRRDFDRRQREMRKSAWKVFSGKDTGAAQKIAALSFLAGLDKHAIKFFESAGFFKQLMQGDEDAFEGLSIDELREIGREILDKLDKEKHEERPGGPDEKDS